MKRNIIKIRIFAAAMSLSTVIFSGCGNKNLVDSDELDKALNLVESLELENESLCQINTQLSEQLTEEQKKNESLAQENESLTQKNKSLLYELEIKNEYSEYMVVDSYPMYQDTIGAFRFHYCMKRIDNGAWVFDEIGPEFKVVGNKESKFLVNAFDESEVYLQGFEKLGHPFYFKGYDPSFGGKDSVDKYSGWVLPVYYGDTFSLYDFDDFHLLLTDCDLDADFREYHDICGGNPISCFYLEAYDPIYGGHDKRDNGCGLVCQISKDNVNYLVDANDFSTILDSGFVNHVYSYEDKEGITRAVFIYGDMEDVWYSSENAVPLQEIHRAAIDIEPYSSNILLKRKIGF